jgi:circadian clock protein KaiB
LSEATPSLPRTYKGIALFTPGGDLVYGIDANKQGQWHLQLCLALQRLLGLPEPPHFLIPCYTATVDRWIDPHTQDVRVYAEAYPLVLRYRALLNLLFDDRDLIWHPAPRTEETCHPLVLQTYRDRFAQLWECHDLVVKVDAQGKLSYAPPEPRVLSKDFPKSNTSGCVFRLFVSGYNKLTETTLARLHDVLEKSLGCPYTLKIIDIVKHPEEAEKNQISATPTFVKVWPPPTRRLVGELQEEELSQLIRYLRV